jgi:3'(2'), 5'-bisphosphate nucleotidase
VSTRWQRELDEACLIARGAGRLILEVYATAFDVQHKPEEGGPVTLADERANAFIVDALERAFPGDEVVAEESPTPEAGRPRPSRCWFVDPVDGTAEFVDRNGMFAVHIGLAVAGEAVAGVVYAPSTDTLYAGAVDGECVREAGGVRRTVRMAPAPEAGQLRLVVSRSHRSKKTELIREALGVGQVLEHGSVGLKCGLLAEGAADLYLHPSPRSYRWDSCAPEAIVRAAGGVLLDFAGQPYRYDQPELRNSRGILACGMDALPRILPVVERVARETGLLPPP